MNLLATILPAWVRWLALMSAAAVFGTLCYNKGKQNEGEKHVAYISQQAGQTIKIAKAQQVVVTLTQIKYVDRIKTIYVV
jgi:Flp pilus assembly protein CpaB